MKQTGIADVKLQNRLRVAAYCIEHGSASRSDIASALGLSTPTVLQNVSELLHIGFLCETGSLSSTGGRKAKLLSLRDGFLYGAGMEITKNHIQLVLLDLSRRIQDAERVRCPYEDSRDYYEYLGKLLEQFLQKNDAALHAAGRNRLAGAGLSLPGIIDAKQGLLKVSHALSVTDVPLKRFSQDISCPVCFENDANNSAYGDIRGLSQNAVYLSLNETVGGAIYIHGDTYPGDRYQSAEFGHVVLERNGRKCYCGKEGCFDAYCSARLLQCREGETLDQFMDAVRKTELSHLALWDEYLDYLALMVSNLRVAFDCRVILGGYVGGCLQDDLPQLEEKLQKLDPTERDMTYVSAGHYGRECSAIGAAKRIMDGKLPEILAG